jgi:predicted Zn finger-like uncharacterized protein
MKVSCQACGAKYTIADDKVRGRKVKIRCKSCGTPIVVDGNAPAEADDAAGAAAPAVSIEPPAVSGGSWSVNLSDTDQRTMTTQEIADAWKAGVLTHDAYVWKDGMGDWVAILDSELQPLLGAPGTGAAPFAANTPFVPPATPFVPPVAARSSMPAARANTSKSGVDLFDASSSSGSEEDDVATSAPHLPMAGTSAYDDKPTGARNENSVLFSLDSLKGGLVPEPKKAVASKRPGPETSDPFAMSAPNDLMSGSANPLFSLNANQALLTAPAPPEPPPPRFDASGAPAKPMNKLLVFGGAGAAAVLLLVVGLLLGRSGRGDEDATAEGAASANSAEGEAEKKEAKQDEKKDSVEKTEPKEEAKQAEPAATASAAPTANTPTTPATSTPTPTGPKVASGGSKAPAEKKPEPAAPIQGTSPFSVSAAQVALTQAASNAGGCRKAGGPTGSGKVQVTFATSGRVTSANVTGGAFPGTSVGGCVASVFRKARIPAFSGNPVTVSKSFSVK